jgi:hypothetical protein
MAIELTPIPASDTYSADEDIYNAYGVENVDSWASLSANATSDEITARKAWSRGEAKILIEEVLSAADLEIPATAGNFTYFASLPSIEAELAGVLLYQSRGIRDQQSNPGDADGAMQGHYDRALARLGRLVAAEQAGDDDDATSAPGTFGSVNMTFEPECTGDEFASY